MKIAAHLGKFRNLDGTLRRLDPRSDSELWIWTAMNAGVHLLNAALHHAGVTHEIDSFHTQVEGLYAAPDRARGVFTDVLHEPGDVMHVGQPPIAQPLPSEIQQACVSLKLIEDLREPHVRGSEPIHPGAEKEWVRAYRDCVERLLGALGALGKIQ
jgi:hypothetical protein